MTPGKEETIKIAKEAYQDMEAPIDKEQVVKAIENLKNGELTGKNGITAEVSDIIDEIIEYSILEKLRKVRVEVTIPSAWKGLLVLYIKQAVKT